MISTFIVDDKQANIKTLQKLIEKYDSDLTVVGTSTSVAEAHGLILAAKPQLVFLDVEMNDGTGFDLLAKFERIPFEVIFVTAYDQYAVKAFRENVLDYILKPIDINVFKEAVSKAKKQLGQKNGNNSLEQFMQQFAARNTQKISLPTLEGYLFLAQDDIVRCEASGSYSYFYLQSGKKLMVSLNLKSCEELLPVSDFFRVHHSHIINLNYVTRYIRGRGGYIQMQDGTQVEVAVRRKEEFLEAMKIRQ